MMKYLRILFGVVAIAAASAATAWYVWDRATGGLPEGIAMGNGRIEAEQIDVATRTPGRVLQVHVEEGALVEAGDVLAIMDTSELEAQLARAEADVARAESQVSEVRALIDQRRADLQLAKDEHERARALADRGVTSQSALEQQATRRASAEAALNVANAQLNSAERGVDAAAALVNQYRTQIADATLTAPTFGRILYRLAQPGEVLGGGGKVLTLLDLSQVYMEIFLPAAESARTAIGAEARIRMDAIDYAIPAYVSFISPEAQFTPKQVETRDEREKLMFRVKVRVPEELVRAYIDQVKTGIRGIAFIRLMGAEDLAWPAELVGRPIPPAALPPGLAPGT